MKKNILSLVFAIVCILTSGIILTACKQNDWNPPNNIVQNLPEKIHVVYNANEYSSGLIIVKDGDEYYINGKNKWHADRKEIYMKTNLANEVCKAEDGQGWGSISAHWNGSTWILASNETEYTPADRKSVV